jgi:hypothetical protein
LRAARRAASRAAAAANHATIVDPQVLVMPRQVGQSARMSESAGAEISERVVAAVPEFSLEAREHVASNGVVLPHVLFGDFTRFVVAAFDRHDEQLVSRCLQLMETMLDQGDATIRNLVQVSFVENVGPHLPAMAAFISAWPPLHRAEAERQRTGGPRADTRRSARSVVRDFAEHHLEGDERILAVLPNAIGPLPPWTPVIPIVGVLAMFTRWFRVYAVVTTNQRLLLIRRRKIRPGRPQRVDLAVPCDQARAVSWRSSRRYGTLVIDADGRSIRLHVVATFVADVPAVVETLRR